MGRGSDGDGPGAEIESRGSRPPAGAGQLPLQRRARRVSVRPPLGCGRWWCRLTSTLPRRLCDSDVAGRDRSGARWEG